MFFKKFWFIRLLIYFFISSFLFFVLFANSLSVFKEKVVKPVITSEAASKKLNISVNACIGTCLYSKQKSNFWFLIEEGMVFDNDTSFAVFNENSKLMLTINEDVSAYLSDDAILAVSFDGVKIKLNLKQACIALNTRSEKSIAFLENINSDVDITGLRYYCFNDTDLKKENIPQQITDLLSINGTFSSFEENVKIFFPCEDTIEIENGDTINLDFNYFTPVFGSRVFQISNDDTFSTLNYSLNEKSFFKSNVALGTGSYYWRIKNLNKNTVSEKCKFNVVKQNGINLVEPKNFEVFNSGPLKFLWLKNNDLNLYNLTISKDYDFSSVVFSKKQKELNYSIDDPIQTLGPGTYFWKIITDANVNSSSRKFTILTDSDLLVYTPVNKTQFKKDTNFVNFRWNYFNNIKTYLLMISKNPSFASIDYSLETKQAFAYVPNLGEGEYFFRVNAIFENNTKITSKIGSFVISDLPLINIIEPVAGGKYNLDRGSFLIKWNCSKDVDYYKVILNGVEKELKNINIEYDTCSYNLEAQNNDLNELLILAYCDGMECAKSKSINFTLVRDNALKLILHEEFNAVELNKKGVAELVFSRKLKNAEYELFNENKKLLNTGSVEKGFISLKIEPNTYKIRIKETEKSYSDFFNFRVIDAKPAMPVLLGPNNRKVAKKNISVMFFWNKTKRAKFYELRIYDTKNNITTYKTEKLYISKKFKVAGQYTWELASLNFLDDKPRYSEPTKKRLLIVR